MVRLVEGKVMVVSTEPVAGDLEALIDDMVAAEETRQREEERRRERELEEYWAAERLRIRNRFMAAITLEQWTVLGLEANAGAKCSAATLFYQGADVTVSLQEDGWAIEAHWASARDYETIVSKYPVEGADLWREILLALASIRAMVARAQAELE